MPPAKGPIANDRDEPIQPQWCLVGNIVDQGPYGDGGRQSRSGTKHFRAGAKVYCLPPQWGDGYERVIVIGYHRGSRRLKTMIVPAKHATNWRAELVYRPAVLRRIHKVVLDDWIPAWHSRESVEQFAEGMRRQDVQKHSKGNTAPEEDMARNSDKLQLLQRRRLELRHAIEHGMSDEAIEIRCEKIKEAAVAVVKKTVV